MWFWTIRLWFPGQPTGFWLLIISWSIPLWGLLIILIRLQHGLQDQIRIIVYLLEHFGPGLWRTNSNVFVNLDHWIQEHFTKKKERAGSIGAAQSLTESPICIVAPHMLCLRRGNSITIGQVGSQSPQNFLPTDPEFFPSRGINLLIPCLFLKLPLIPILQEQQKKPLFLGFLWL